MKRINFLLVHFVVLVASMSLFTSCFTKSVVVEKTDIVTVDDFPTFREQSIGLTHNQIVTKLGAPQRELSDGGGGKILIYENTTTKTVSNTLASAYNVNYITKTYTPGAQTTSTVSTNTEYLQYFVNADGICYEVKTNIPMTHTEESEPYEYVEKKIRWGKSIAVGAGSFVGGFIIVTLLSLIIVPL